MALWDLISGLLRERPKGLEQQIIEHEKTSQAEIRRKIEATEPEHLQKALKLKAAGDRKGALELLKKAVAQNPEDAEAHYQIGNVYSQCRLFMQAGDEVVDMERFELDEAIRLDPSQPKYYFSLGRMLATDIGDIPAAIVSYETGLSLADDDTEGVSMARSHLATLNSTGTQP
jgi:tetratricopeptide (TPR) repeat protein